MAIYRIYDETVGQRAGFLVDTDSMGQIKRDGTNAYAQAVVWVDESGVPITGLAVTIADGADVAEGARDDAAWVSGDGTVIALLKTIATGVLSTVPTTVQGGTAADAAISYAPVTVGARAASSLPTAVASGDVVNQMADLYGRAISPSNLRQLRGSQYTSLSDTTTTAIVTADASNMNDLYGLVLANEGADVVEVLIEDVGADTIKFVIPADDTRGFMLPADSGYKQAAVNTAWNATKATGTGPVRVSALFLKSGS